MQNARIVICASQFEAFTRAILNFNRRTKAANAKLKKARYETVSRIPLSHFDRMIYVEVRIKDRCKVLWQELNEILTRFQSHACRSDQEIIMANCKEQAQALAGRPKNQTMAQARAKMTASAIAASQSMPGKASSKPVEAVSRQWGVWVPCEDETRARSLAAAFAAALALAYNSPPKPRSSAGDRVRTNL